MKLAVIGAGLIGAAAARHLRCDGHDVTLIGPGEPEDRRRHHGVFASHYDEGRITRGLDPSPFWSRASRASIARYADIESGSGIRFYSPVGCMMAGPADSTQAADMVQIAARDGIPCERLGHDALRQRFPYFAFPDDTIALPFIFVPDGQAMPDGGVPAAIRDSPPSPWPPAPAALPGAPPATSNMVPRPRMN